MDVRTIHQNVCMYPKRKKIHQDFPENMLLLCSIRRYYKFCVWNWFGVFYPKKILSSYYIMTASNGQFKYNHNYIMTFPSSNTTKMFSFSNRIAVRRMYSFFYCLSEGRTLLVETTGVMELLPRDKF